MFPSILRSPVVVFGAMALMLSSSSIRQRGLVAAFSHIDIPSTKTLKKGVCTIDGPSRFGTRRSWQERSGPKMFMSTSSPTSTSTETTIIPRVKTADATKSTGGSPVVVKGWVRTVRKQKTLAFVEVNDGSNMKGIQCVLSFDVIDEETQKGT